MRFLIIAFFLLGRCAFAQDDPSLLFQIEGDFDDLYTDQLTNVYTVKGDVIRKYLPDGSLQYEIAPKRNGELSAADFSDPLRPLLYYRDQAVVQILDNTLSEQGDAVDLWATLDRNIWNACLSIDNHFWFYDTDDFELIRADRNFDTVSRSGNLVQILGESIMPEWMLERNSLLYVSDPKRGVLVFDIFGTFIKVLPVQGLDRFQIVNGILVYSEEGQICEYRPLDFETECLEFPVKARQARFMKDKIYLLTDDGIAVYRR